MINTGYKNAMNCRDVKISVSELRMQNFRCFRHTDDPVLLQPDLTVFVAKNGNGKSAVLDALRISLGTFTKAFESLSQARICKTDATLTPERVVKGQGAMYPVCIDAKGVVDGESVGWGRALMDHSGHTTTKEARAVSSYGEKLLSAVVSDSENVELPIIAYYGTGRLWGDVHLRQKDLNRDYASENRFVGYEDALTTNPIYAQVKQWMAYAFQVKSNPVEKDTGIGRSVALQYAAVENAVNQILIGTGFHSPHYNYTYRDVSVLCDVSDGDNRTIAIPVSHTSDGIKAAISLVADIAYRCARLNPSFAEHACERTQGIVMVDEVDLFLHPSWQQHFLMDLRHIFPRIQFIVSTHSPQVVSSVPRDCVRVISDGIVHASPGPTQGVEINELLMRVFGTNPVIENLEIVQKLNRLLVLAAEGEPDDEKWNALYGVLQAHYGCDYGPLVGAARHRDFIRRMRKERGNA